MRNMHRERCPPFVRSTRSHKIQTVTGQESTPFGSARVCPLAFIASAAATTSSEASHTRDYHSFLGWLPKLDRIAIRILSQAKVPMGGYSSVFSMTTPLLLRWLRTSPMFFTV